MLLRENELLVGLSGRETVAVGGVLVILGRPPAKGRLLEPVVDGVWLRVKVSTAEGATITAFRVGAGEGVEMGPSFN